MEVHESHTSNQVGSGGLTALETGHFVAISKLWNCIATLGCVVEVADAGAVTWGSGTTGISGAVSMTNSLIGATASDQIGSEGIRALSNGNYIIVSKLWNCLVILGCDADLSDVGAVTWASGATGKAGKVSSSNSFVGSNASDNLGSGGIYTMPLEHYIVQSPNYGSADLGLLFLANGAEDVFGSL